MRVWYIGCTRTVSTRAGLMIMRFFLYHDHSSLLPLPSIISRSLTFHQEILPQRSNCSLHTRTHLCCYLFAFFRCFLMLHLFDLLTYVKYCHPTLFLPISPLQFVHLSPSSPWHSSPPQCGLGGLLNFLLTLDEEHLSFFPKAPFNSSLPLFPAAIPRVII